GQGRENAKLYLKSNPTVATAIEDKIRAANGLDFHIVDDGKGDDLVDI
ncbi:MAG: DNA recombination/repair protein RecA, partial [Alphaproteobacteria bacterium]|nr:DNA recombination/repair protein RecA [Alphaproteobacteria bacterium]